MAIKLGHKRVMSHIGQTNYVTKIEPTGKKYGLTIQIKYSNRKAVYFYSILSNTEKIIELESHHPIFLYDFISFILENEQTFIDHEKGGFIKEVKELVKLKVWILL